MIGYLTYTRPGIVRAQTGDGTCYNLGTCPDRESNQQPFGYGMILLPTGPYPPEPFKPFLSVHFGGINYIHAVGQLPPLSISKTIPSPQTEILLPLSNNSPFLQRFQVTSEHKIVTILPSN